MTFEFLSNVKSCEIIPNKSQTSSVGANRRIIYNDGIDQLIQITQISQISRSISYSMISSSEPISYTSANHEISLRKVTTSNQTFIEWRTDFSNDASLQVVQDSRYKKREGFKDLKSYLSVKVITQNLDDEKKEDNAKLLTVKIEKTTEDSDVDKIWEIISNFGEVPFAMAPLGRITKCISSQNGKVRTMTIGEKGGTLQETLKSINAEDKTLTYEITQNDALPVKNYSSTMKLSKAGKGCKIDWSAKFYAKEVGDSLAISTIEQVLTNGATQIIAYSKK